MKGHHRTKRAIRPLFNDLLPADELDDILDMWGMWEHIDGLDLSDTVVGIEESQVAGLRGGITADVDDSARCGIEDDTNDIWVHAGTRWVGNDDVGTAVAADKLVGKDILHVTGIENGVVDAVDARVDLGILDGLGHILDAYDIPRMTGHEVGNGARTGIEVIDKREVGGDFISSIVSICFTSRTVVSICLISRRLIISV